MFCKLLVELNLSKVYVQLYGMKQVANFCWLQIYHLIIVFARSCYILPSLVRSGYILSSLVRAVGPYLSRLDNYILLARAEGSC
jgi:hypothetical protein